MDVLTLSASRTLKYLHCPRSYLYQYVIGDPKLPTALLTRGSAFHSTLKFNYRQKFRTHQDLPIRDLSAYFADDFDQIETDFKDDDPGQIKDEGINALETYHRDVAPFVQPIEVEESFVMSFKQVAWNFQGKIDLVDDKLTVIDTKTTSRGLSSPKRDHWIQLAFYVFAYKRKKQVPDMKARIDYNVCGQKKGRVISFELDINQSDERSSLNLLAQVARGIENDVWFHNRIDNYCSRRWCAYWRECESDCGGTVRA